MPITKHTEESKKKIAAGVKRAHRIRKFKNPGITINVDKQVYHKLLERVVDFNDTPNAVLRRLFNLK